MWLLRSSIKFEQRELREGYFKEFLSQICYAYFTINLLFICYDVVLKVLLKYC